MTLGPATARACPACRTAVAEISLMSGNTLGATFWSDGKVDAPMMPDLPDVVRCPSCAAVFRLSTAEEALDVDAESLPWPPDPDADLFREALEAGLAESEPDEVGLRLRWWWAANDPHRGGEPSPPNEPMAANLGRLADLLGSDADSGHTVGAEVVRALGRFEEAAALYERAEAAADEGSALAERAAQLRPLAEAGSRAVVEVWADR